jgi:hypothetical protein
MYKAEGHRSEARATAHGRIDLRAAVHPPTLRHHPSTHRCPAETLPWEQAAWRIPVWFFCNIIGMAIGAWLAGDQLGTYAPAFLFGILMNIANIVIIWCLAALGIDK